jgi:hypothetical protein
MRQQVNYMKIRLSYYPTAQPIILLPSCLIDLLPHCPRCLIALLTY